MAFDRHGDVRVAPQPVGLPGQDLLRFRRDVRAVEGKEDAVPRTRLEILLRTRDDVPRANAGATRRPWRTRGRLGRWRRAATGGKHQQSTQQRDYSCVHLIPLIRKPGLPETASERVAVLPSGPAAFSEVTETKPGRMHPAGWSPRADWIRSGRSNRGAPTRHNRANRRPTGENTSKRARLAPRSVLRPENRASAAARRNHPAA